MRVVTVESPGELRRLARHRGAASAAGSRSCSAPPSPRPRASSASGSSATTAPASSGWTPRTCGSRRPRRSRRLARARRACTRSGRRTCSTPVALAAHVDATVATATELAADAGFPLRLVDAGGGLGIPYETHEDAARPARRSGRGSRRSRPASPPTRRRATRASSSSPAGSSSAPAGAYVARVVDRKAVGGHHVVILDGGIHHVLRPALVGQEHRVRVLTGAASTPAAVNAQRFPVTIAGPLCSGLDVFAQSAVMAVPDPGDLVAVLDVGAYGATESMPFFLSHPLPPEIAIRDGEAWVSRPRIEPDTWLGLAGRRSGVGEQGSRRARRRSSTTAPTPRPGAPAACCCTSRASPTPIAPASRSACGGRASRRAPPSTSPVTGRPWASRRRCTSPSTSSATRSNGPAPDRSGSSRRRSRRVYSRGVCSTKRSRSSCPSRG